MCVVRFAPSRITPTAIATRGRPRSSATTIGIGDEVDVRARIAQRRQVVGDPVDQAVVRQLEEAAEDRPVGAPHEADVERGEPRHQEQHGAPGRARQRPSGSNHHGLSLAIQAALVRRVLSALVLELVPRASRDPQLGRDAGAAHVRVVLDVLGRGHVHAQPGGQLEPAGLVEQLLVAGGLARAALDVEEVDTGAELPALAARGLRPVPPWRARPRRRRAGGAGRSRRRARAKGARSCAGRAPGRSRPARLAPAPPRMASATGPTSTNSTWLA